MVYNWILIGKSKTGKYSFWECEISTMKHIFNVTIEDNKPDSDSGYFNLNFVIDIKHDGFIPNENHQA